MTRFLQRIVSETCKVTILVIVYRQNAVRGDYTQESTQADVMRVIVFVHASKDSEAGVMPSTELLTSMGAYNQELIEAGIMRDGAGVRVSRRDAEVME